MDKHTGGAKPKTGPGTLSNNSGSRSGAGSTSSGSQTGAQPRHRSPRRDNGYATRSNGGAARGVRNTGSNSNASSSTAGSSPPPRRSIPNSVARASFQTRSNASQRPSFTEYSPLRGGRTVTRNQPRQNGNSTFRRPVLRPQNSRNAETMTTSPSQNQTYEEPSGTEVLEASGPEVHHNSSDSDSDFEPVSPMSPAESAQPCPQSLHQLSALRENGSRPASSSRDAVLARELLQAEMDQMMERDEELARQLQADMDREERPALLSHPLSMFFPGGLQARGRHFPSIPGRMEGGRGARGADHRNTRALRVVRGPDGEVRMGFELPGRGGMRSVMRAVGPRVSMGLRNRRLAVRESDLEPAAEPGPAEPDPEESPVGPSDEFDPDERLLGSGADPPDDFLSMMNDPSLMLLMLLLRAPDSLYQNDAGVDLDDYDGLWELAERLGEVRRRGISDEQINRLPTHKFRPQNGESSAAASGSAQCQICLVDFENGDCLRGIPCKHDFHKSCIDEWLKRNATCPICRQGVKPSDT